MSRANEIYNLDGSIRKEMENLKSEMNGETILRYQQRRVAEGISLSRQFKCMKTLKSISRILNRRFDEATKEDIVRLIVEIEQKPLSVWTKHDYKVILKKFYQWLYNYEEGYPPVVKWIKASNNISNGLKKSDLLTPEEVKKLVEAATTLRDKALILVLAESGRRIGEILTLRIGDVEFDNMGARILVDGKTGRDHVRIIASAPTLATWLDNHPVRNDPKAPVWIGSNHGVLKQITYASARSMMKDCIAHAGLKKRIWFHLFRHTRGTQASKLLTSPQLCALMGWRQGSKMPSVYIHLAGEDIDEAQAIMSGVKVENKNEPKLEPVICSRCNHVNSTTAKFCNKCGLVLDIKTIIEIDSARQKVNLLIEKLTKNPEILDNILHIFNELQPDQSKTK
ncbi:MAG: tyrosine-type recombinase/integrase [Nitrososphaerales archaeon]